MRHTRSGGVGGVGRRWVAPWAVVSLTVPVGCEPPPAPLFGLEAIGTELVEVLPCRSSHDHELRHVRIFADPVAAQIYERCVLGSTGPCPDSGFPADSLFLKLEYELAGCADDELLSYTATLRLEDGAYPEGLDWHWQRCSPQLRVEEDGAPARCLGCHTEHCAPPHGFDLRCVPD